MALKLGNTNIGEMYVGNTKIAQAYLGSTLVYQLSSPITNYDYYKVSLTWDHVDNFNMAGLKIDGVQAQISQVPAIMYCNNDNNLWYQISDSDVASAINWYNNNGYTMHCKAIDIIFTNDTVPSTVQVHTGLWYGGGSMTVTIHVYGVKDGVGTDLGYTSGSNRPDKTYTINL